MNKIIVGTGVVHKVPKDLRLTIESNADVLKLWNGLTPLARNECICWVTIVKKDKTRAEYLIQLYEDLRTEKHHLYC